MRKLIAVAMLVGGLVAVAGQATAQNNPGGVADPLTLAASGVLMPFFGGPGDVAVLEVHSPIGDNNALHMFFFDGYCSRVGPSKFLPTTINDVEFLTIVGNGSGFGNPGGGFLDPEGFFEGNDPRRGGLITIARSLDSFNLIPLANPIHSRVFVYNGSNGSSRFIEPIILDAAEYPSDPATGIGDHTWSPLRTAATFFAPQEGFLFPNGAEITNRLWLICPRYTVVGSRYFDPSAGFPPINPSFKGGYSFNTDDGSIAAVIFDANEKPLLDIHTGCDCVTTVDRLTDLNPIYGSAIAVNGTYTKMGTNFSNSQNTAFTGYKSTSANPVNDFFGRLFNGSTYSIDGRFPTGVVQQQR